VIFDLDGVLVESEPYWQQGFADAVNARLDAAGSSLARFEADAMASYRGGRVNETLTDILRSIGDDAADDPAVIGRLTEQVVAQVSAAFVADPRPIASSVAVARSLHDRGTTVAVASSSAPEFIATALQATGLDAAVSVARSALHLEHGKPHPQVHLDTLAALGESADACVAVEDSDRGIDAAVAAGIPCVGLWQGGGPAPASFAACERVTTDLTVADVDTVLGRP
jgi:sugar-phosphatase